MPITSTRYFTYHLEIPRNCGPNRRPRRPSHGLAERPEDDPLCFGLPDDPHLCVSGGRVAGEEDNPVAFSFHETPAEIPVGNQRRPKLPLLLSLPQQDRQLVRQVQGIPQEISALGPSGLCLRIEETLSLPRRALVQLFEGE